MQILIADDNPVNQMVAHGFLKRLGYDCKVVSDGIEVLAAFEEDTYNLVFMDLEMPNLGGVEATSKLRELYGSSPYVIAMSAHDESQIKGAFQEYQMNDYVTKPVSKQAFEAAIDRYSQQLA